jgi:hypothetical protein
VSMCDGTDDPDIKRWDKPTEPSGTTLSELGQPNQVRQPSRTGTAQPSGTAQAELGQPSRLGRPSPNSELGHTKDRLSQSGPGRPSPLGRPAQTWSGPIFSQLLSTHLAFLLSAFLSALNVMTYVDRPYINTPFVHV